MPAPMIIMRLGTRGALVVSFIVLAATLGCEASSKEPQPSSPREVDQASKTAPPQPQMARITGKVMKIDRLPWKSGAMLTVDLVELTYGREVQARGIASNTVELPELPAAYSLPYDRSLIDEQMHYALVASVHDGNGKLIYGTAARVPVLTHGADTRDVNLILKIAGLLPRRR